MNWESHYTGVETFHFYQHRTEVYLQRNGKSKQITFFRIGIRTLYFGAFLGRLNYAAPGRGIEFFSNRFGIAFRSAPDRAEKFIKYHGSSTSPFYSVSLRLRLLVIFFDLPLFIQKQLQERRDKRNEEFYNSIEEA